MSTRRVSTPTVLQMDATECGAAALAMVLGSFGRVVPLEELREACGVSRDGSKASSLLKVAREHGLYAKGFTKEVDGLAGLPLPLIAFWNFNHFVVIEGFGPDGVYLNDPASGRRRVTPADFDAAFTGVVLVFERAPDFRPGGSRPGLWPVLRRRLRGSGWSLLCLLLASLVLLVPGVVLPVVTGAFVDHVLVGHEADWVAPLLLALAGLVVLRAGLTWLQGWLLVWLEARLALRGAHELFGHVLRLPISFFAQRFAGEIASRVAITDRLARLLTGDLASSAIGAALVLVYLVLMARFDGPLALIGAAGALLNVAVLRSTTRRRVDAQQRVLQDSSAWMGATFATLQTIETLKSTGTESDAFARWAGYQARVVNTSAVQIATTLPLLVVPPLLTSLTVAATLVLGGLRVIDGSLTAGGLVAFQGLLLAFLMPFSSLVGLGGTLQEAQGSLARLDDVLRARADPQVAEPERSASPRHRPGEPAPCRLLGKVELRGLTFGYSRRDPPLIENLDLAISPGAHVALVGGSASGKSTVARLVAGLYQPWHGQVLLDGTPRPDFPRARLTHSLAMVDQDIALFGGTIRDNLTLWDERVPLEAVVRAAQDAAIHADILALPRGYDTPLDEQGRNLSGGQRQRLEIARALVGDPSVLVLDEATSGLDPVTEATVMANLKRRGCTCLIVAHRLSAIRDADEILVLDKGNVVQRGQHAELGSVPGAYRRLLDSAPAEALPANDRQSYALVATRAASLGARPHSGPVPAPQPGGEPRDAHPSVAQAATTSPETLLAACRLVAERLAISIRPAPTDTPDEEQLDGIARASRVRLRHVRLADGWWRADGGPLLGYLASDGTPVALLPSRPGRYVLAAPGNSRVAVTPETAATLARTAVMFYRPLPERAIGAGDLLRLGLLGCRADLLTMLGAALASACLALALPLATGVLYDRLLPSGLRGPLVLLGLGLAAVALGVASLGVLQGLATLRVESRSDAMLQAAVWDRLLALPARFFRAYDVGDLGARAMAISGIRQVLSTTAISSAVGAVCAVVSFGLLFVYSVPLALLTLGLVFVYSAISLGAGLLELRRQRAATVLEGHLSGLVLQLLSGVVRLRVAGAEGRAFDRWAKAFAAQRQAVRRVGLVRAAASAWNAAFPVLATLVLFAAVASPRSGPTLDVGTFLAFSAAYGQCLAAAWALAGPALAILAAVPLYERARPILSALPETSATGAHPGRLLGEVRLEGVSFRYGPLEPWVLKDVSLTLRPGACLAVVGPSGSGKSTLMRLLLGMEHPESGRVLYDGRDLATLDAREVRRQIGVVLQDGAVLPDDVLHNILGAAPMSVEDAWEAARLAGLEADIRAMPMGMYTRVPEGGATFSGGQRQRLLIARALVRRPRLVFFDEATSALDNATQAVVSSSLAGLYASRLLIAHRLSTVQYADSIVVLAGGQVVQVGRFEDLVGQQGLFSQLARPQLA
jgi:NHLM bacteriocin system ABC transporter peptidase/ATP-binding protein/NHLM bacteriocin system ABC transporter ATP-binding protein